jgi:FkbH-like protein
VLVEDGPEKIRLKPEITEIFAELDRRGILLSLASKNNHGDVLPLLKRFGLADYILKPQISWEPKSQAVRRIAKSLEIGLDSLLYVDDSPFEREEVRAACPEVRVIDAVDTNWLLWREDCQVPVTAESASRRKLYRDQELRQEAQEDFKGDYETFLRDCAIRVRLSSIDEALLPRVHELAQRTNQMNFSGTRYTREQLERIRTDKNLDAIAVQVDDRFGAYGIVGLAIVDRERNTLTDLAFSCRIQAKRIEHAVLSYLLNRHGKRPFRARWRKTERNAPAGRVFSDLGFRELGQADGVTDLEFNAAKVPMFEFIEVTDATRS